MKKKLTPCLHLFAILSFCFSGCEDALKEEVYSQLAPENFLTTEEGIQSVLFAAYAEQAIIGNRGNFIVHAEEWSTDIEWETGGGANRTATLFINFTWDPSTDIIFNMWQPQYRAIRNANLVLENLENTSISEEAKSLYAAEAKFIRALSYTRLFNWFGPIPLRTSSEQALELSRAGSEEIQSFVESELLAAIPVLPEPGQEAAYGRATSGAARAVLAKFYLNIKQWQKAADMAQEVIDMETYSLYPEYEDLFKVQNEENSEFIFVNTAIPDGPGNQHMNGAFPVGFAKDPRTGLTFQNTWRNWARQDRLWDGFYHSFSPDDQRANLIMKTYINNAGDTVSLLNNDNTRSFKFWPDPNGLGNNHGNDLPEIRYADILLSRAEALNELNGPNQESIDLINQVRNRASLDDLSVNDFATKEDLQEHILQERGWEFYSERKRRQDLIRMEKYIPFAQSRGITNAEPYRIYFPIPQSAMDSNPKLVQNERY
jgi:hypothetical protein